MQYRSDKYGNKISILGYGCMRFPRTMGMIDKKETEREILAAFRKGVNYYDTAYIYPGSEAMLGEILQKHGIREKVYIATKLPHYLIRSREGMESLFQEQLKRLQTDYVDYYLMHMLTDLAAWERMEELGVKEWLQEKQKSGQIRQIGFSYHGNADMFCRYALVCVRLNSLCLFDFIDLVRPGGRVNEENPLSNGNALVFKIRELQIKRHFLLRPLRPFCVIPYKQGLTRHVKKGELHHYTHLSRYLIVPTPYIT